ncbi:MAG: prolyl oligopeptidase family serine peptidase [Candidatus Acidiferrales bacterium]
MLRTKFEQWIRRYEHGRWADEKNRKTLPFAWGLEHIGGRANDPNPREFLDAFAEKTLANSDAWFGADPAGDYRLTESHEARGESGVLTFTSAIESPWTVNNTVHARFFPARHSGPAVIVLAQWNAKWHEQVAVCQWLQRLGISALRMSLPYHDRRAIPDHPRGDHLVGPNIGLTLQASRQAVCDVRACVRWLETQGYDKLGIMGTSVGSAIAFISFVHEPRFRAGSFLHVSTYFGDVAANGMTTINVWEPLRTKVNQNEIRRYWSPISPFPYIGKLRGTRKKILAITAQYDPTFWPELTEEFLAAVREEGVPVEILRLPCGHYSLGEPPFSYIAGFRFGSFLFQALS